MAEQMVQIRSWKHYWNDYIIEGLKKGSGNEEIRANVLETLRKEVFGQLMFRTKVEDVANIEQTDKNVEIVESIAKTTQQKFNALLRECRKYKETCDIFADTDLSTVFPQEEDEEEGEIVEEKDAEWPELNNFDDVQAAEIEQLESVDQEYMAENMEKALDNNYSMEEAETREKNTHVSEGT